MPARTLRARAAAAGRAGRSRSPSGGRDSTGRRWRRAAPAATDAAAGSGSDAARARSRTRSPAPRPPSNCSASAGSAFRTEYTAAMPIDVAARVIANRPLSSDYNVLALAAPAIAATAAPGQFVMVKPSAGSDPLLRRPFSVFEVLRDSDGTPNGITILSKRIGPSTSLIYDTRAGARVSCLGPLGRPFTVIDPPADAWMVA